MLGTQLLIAGVILHNALLLPDLDWSAVLWYAAFVEAYALLSWAALARWYAPGARFDLGLVFLVLDLAPLALTVYVTGADRSWVFWVFLFRVGDQTSTYFRRALLFTHLGALSYLAVVGYAALVDGRAVSWPPELAKAAFLYLGALYISMTARTTERIRDQLRSAIHVARDSVARLSEKSRELDRARRQAESASRAKSEFLSRVSHELRTPMNAILGFAQLLGMENLPPEQRAHVDEILEGGRHLLDTINDVMDIARVEKGALARELGPVPLRDALARVLDAARPGAAARSITLPAAPDDACDVLLLADPRKLRQAVAHLVSNAVRHGGTGGAVEVGCEVRGEVVRVSIGDRGPGIPEDEVEAAFTPFVRLEREGEAAEEGGGTGLGLPLARALVEAMGGALGYDPRHGGGSTFWFELPLAPAPDAAPDGESVLPGGAARAGHGHGTGAATVVLYIDDKPENVVLVRRILARRPGTELITAPLGRMGLEAARERRPDLVLLDLELPDIDGREVFRLLRTDPATAAIPVVVVSAEARPTTVERLLAEGARAYLTMPYDVAEFLATLDRALNPSGR